MVEQRAVYGSNLRHTRGAGFTGRSNAPRAWATLYTLVILAAVVIAFKIVWHAYLQSSMQPVCCDVASYWSIAHTYANAGIFASHSTVDLRTYAYPWLLSLSVRMAHSTGVEPGMLVAMGQFFAYLASSWYLASSPRWSIGHRVGMFVLLALNIFALPYAAIALTDAPALTVFQIWLGAVVRQFRTMEPACGHEWIRISPLLLAGLSAGAAMALRPAFLWLPVVTVLLLLFARARAGLSRYGRARRLAIALIFIALPLLPQMAINQIFYSSPSPLPHTDLGSQQIEWGKQYLKYATRRYISAPQGQLYYVNPFYELGASAADRSSLDWYVSHPLDGTATLAAKLVGAFDFDFTEPYIYDPIPPSQKTTRTLSFLIFFLGICAMFGQFLRRERRIVDLGPRALPLIIFVAWGSVTLVSAVELRFSLPIISLFLLLIVGMAAEVKEMAWRSRLAGLVACAVAVSALFVIGNLVRSSIVL